MFALSSVRCMRSKVEKRPR
ncbi:TPA: hypothetical protein N0F65_007870 [Lagenidium giganteum]|uniref:Uncharacterized protein n=1 Tax=Lagenidium giganteum TaxID=4803 RepID=A0AAV2Z1R3_9STRA|nr:TPA: hypothetical protein N0F65_007870 [Lagenidium giganteum]